MNYEVLEGEGDSSKVYDVHQSLEEDCSDGDPARRPYVRALKLCLGALKTKRFFLRTTSAPLGATTFNESPMQSSLFLRKTL